MEIVIRSKAALGLMVSRVRPFLDHASQSQIKNALAIYNNDNIDNNEAIKMLNDCLSNCGEKYYWMIEKMPTTQNAQVNDMFRDLAHSLCVINRARTAFYMLRRGVEGAPCPCPKMSWDDVLQKVTEYSTDDNDLVMHIIANTLDNKIIEYGIDSPICREAATSLTYKIKIEDLAFSMPNPVESNGAGLLGGDVQANPWVAPVVAPAAPVVAPAAPVVAPAAPVVAPAAPVVAPAAPVVAPAAPVVAPAAPVVAPAAPAAAGVPPPPPPLPAAPAAAGGPSPPPPPPAALVVAPAAPAAAKVSKTPPPPSQANPAASTKGAQGGGFSELMNQVEKGVTLKSTKKPEDTPRADVSDHFRAELYQAMLSRRAAISPEDSAVKQETNTGMFSASTKLLALADNSAVAAMERVRLDSTQGSDGWDDDDNVAPVSSVTPAVQATPLQFRLLRLLQLLQSSGC
jgi:hypothetical protein